MSKNCYDETTAWFVSRLIEKRDEAKRVAEDICRRAVDAEITKLDRKDLRALRKELEGRADEVERIAGEMETMIGDFYDDREPTTDDKIDGLRESVRLLRDVGFAQHELSKAILRVSGAQERFYKPEACFHGFEEEE